MGLRGEELLQHCEGERMKSSPKVTWQCRSSCECFAEGWRKALVNGCGVLWLEVESRRGRKEQGKWVGKGGKRREEGVTAAAVGRGRGVRCSCSSSSRALRIVSKQQQQQQQQQQQEQGRREGGKEGRREGGKEGRRDGGMEGRRREGGGREEGGERREAKGGR